MAVEDDRNRCLVGTAGSESRCSERRSSAGSVRSGRFGVRPSSKVRLEEATV